MEKKCENNTTRKTKNKKKKNKKLFVVRFAQDRGGGIPEEHGGDRSQGQSAKNLKLR